MNDPSEYARRYLQESARVAAATASACLDDVLAAADLLTARLRAGGKILICGNGGSAADAQHLAAELVSTLTRDNRRPAIPALALTTDTSILTAIGNDYGFDGVFERQVEALGRSGDALIAISTSGTSANVLLAADRARSQGLAVIGLTGSDGGELAGRADVAIQIPSEETSHIQESHLAVEQLLAFLIEAELHPR